LFERRLEIGSGFVVLALELAANAEDPVDLSRRKGVNVLQLFIGFLVPAEPSQRILVAPVRGYR
jgi:hypothetical protein